MRGDHAEGCQSFPPGDAGQICRTNSPPRDARPVIAQLAGFEIDAMPGQNRVPRHSRCSKAGKGYTRAFATLHSLGAASAG